METILIICSVKYRSMRTTEQILQMIVNCDLPYNPQIQRKSLKAGYCLHGNHSQSSKSTSLRQSVTKLVRIDPDATPIPVPGSRPNPAVTQSMVHTQAHSLKEKPVLTSHQIPKGPAPVNTLTQGQNSQNHSNHTSYPSSFAASFPRGGPRPLPTISSTGVNVTATAARRPSPTSTDSGRPTKRQKKGTMGLQSKEIVEITDESEEEDELNSKTSINLVKSQRLPLRHNSPSRKQVSGPGQFSAIDQMMDSSEYAKNPPKVDPLEDAVVSKTLWRSTARPGGISRGCRPAESKESKVMQTEEISRHFPSNGNQDTKVPMANPFRNNPARGNQPGVAERNLRDQFRGTNGKHRGSDGGFSADELTGGPMEGGYAYVTRVRPPTKLPQKPPLHSRSPTPVATNPRDRSVETLPESNIRSTTFKKPSKKRKSIDQGPWDVVATELLSDYALLKSGGSETTDPSKSIRIFRREGLKGGTKEYDILSDGTNSSLQQPQLCISTTKLRAVSWALDCPILRFDMLKVQSENPRIDVILQSHFHAAKLVKDISAISSIRVQRKEKYSSSIYYYQEIGLISFSDHMKKAFDKRKLELLERGPNKPCDVVDETIELDLIQHNVQKRHDALRSGREQESMNVKRQRTNGRPTDRLVTRQDHANMEKSIRGTHDPTDDPNSIAATGEKSIDGILKELNVYSTRSQNRSAAQKTQRRESSPQEEFPELSRYSVAEGLGIPWVKPLIYPKDGKKKATVEWEDLIRLDEGEFFNDNLISFYLRFLENKLEREHPDIARKIYWFNSFFFEALTKSTKGKRCNYDAVRKWTRSTDIFTYDYLIIPINEQAHWYLAIIYNLPALNRMPDVSARSTPDSSAVNARCESPGKEAVADRTLVERILEDATLSSSPDAGSETYEEGTRESLAGLSLNGIKQVPEQTAKGQRSPSSRKDIYDVESESEAQLHREDKLYAEATSDLGLDSGPIKQAENDRIETDTATQPSGLVLAKSANSLKSNKKARRKSIPPVRALDPNKPAIIIIDSLGSSHPSTTRCLKDYLHDEAKDKRGGMRWEDNEIKGMTASKIPLQTNFCDCGVYLLGYIEKFILDPKAFVERILSRSDFSQKSDFPRLVAPEMRSEIRELLFELHNEQEPREADRQKKAAKVKGTKQMATKDSSIEKAFSSKHNGSSHQPQRVNQVDGVTDHKIVGNGAKTAWTEDPLIDLQLPTEQTIPQLMNPEAINHLEAVRREKSLDIRSVEDEVNVKNISTVDDTNLIRDPSNAEDDAVVRDSFVDEETFVDDIPKAGPGSERASPIILDSQPEPVISLAQSVTIRQLEQISQELDEPRIEIRPENSRHKLSSSPDETQIPMDGKQQSPPKRARVEVVIQSPPLRKQSEQSIVAISGS